MIAILLHKPNVWYELHGWSPKYLTDKPKRESPRRLCERVPSPTIRGSVTSSWSLTGPS
jgi:hypothetical protein